MSGSVCRACLHLKGQGRFVLEIRLDFILWVFHLGHVLDFSGITVFWSWFVMAARGRSYLGFGLLLIVSRSLYYLSLLVCYCSYLIFWRIISNYIPCEFCAPSITFGYCTQLFCPLLRKLLVVDLDPKYYIHFCGWDSLIVFEYCCRENPWQLIRYCTSLLVCESWVFYLAHNSFTPGSSCAN